MDTRISLLAIEGPLTGQEYVFSGRASCVLGRSRDCQLQLPSQDVIALMASRHHCRIDVEPPFVCVRDLGSLNGTFVNGKNIGRRDKGAAPGQTPSTELEAIELHDGDRLLVGGNEFLIAIHNSMENIDKTELSLREAGQSSGALALCG